MIKNVKPLKSLALCLRATSRPRALEDNLIELGSSTIGTGEGEAGGEAEAVAAGDGDGDGDGVVVRRARLRGVRIESVSLSL